MALSASLSKAVTAHLEMFFFCVLDLVVTDAVQALDKHHDGRNAGAGHFGGIMQGTGGQAMRFCAGFANGFIGKGDELVVEQDGFDLPDPFPGEVDVSFFGEMLAGRSLLRSAFVRELWRRDGADRG